MRFQTCLLLQVLQDAQIGDKDVDNLVRWLHCCSMCRIWSALHSQHPQPALYLSGCFVSSWHQAVWDVHMRGELPDSGCFT